jgi:DNA (cytosine-5)-methyltransferase 1
MEVKVGSDFSGVGAFNQALTRLGINYRELFACDMDKYSRQTFIQNYGEPEYFPENVYDRKIPSESLDIYMTSPPCQAFSMAGKRLGKDDDRGILFFNSLEFIRVNKPRFFIFENVRGLLSHDKANKKDKIGRTFQEWIDYLGGKSVNGIATMMPTEDSVPYHLHWKVLNAKKHGIPQNRERVFLIGIRDDHDNTFTWPEDEELTKRLKDVLEENVDDKYFLSEKMINGFTKHNDNHNEKGTGFIFTPKDGDDVASCIRANAALCPTDNSIKIGTWRTHEDGKGFREIEDGNCPTIPARAREDRSGQPVIKINSATSKGYEEATEGDSINFSVPNSQTRRGRVGKGVAQTLDTACNQGVIQYNCKRLNETIQQNDLPIGMPKVIDTYNRKVQDHSPTLTEPHHNTTRLWDGVKIRRLTPRECFRLMDFPDTFTWPVSDSQAYKQAGNSIVVRVLEKIIKNLPL